MQHLHLIGIEGIGMSGLAEILISAGFQVSGCDLHPGSYCESLVKRGARILAGHHKSHIHPPIDAVVASPAVDKQNQEMEEAQQQGIPVWRYTEMLGKVMSTKLQLAVAGTHGKSTTTGMLAYALTSAQHDPSFVVGAHVPQLNSNAHLGQGDHFIVEACEYRRSFMNFSPHMAIITNIERDHLDYYHDLQDIASAFADFAAKIPAHGFLVLDPQARSYFPKQPNCPVETYSIRDHADWQVINVAKLPKGHRFEVCYQGKNSGEFQTMLPGIHNVSNALAVIALCHHLGVAYPVLRTAIAQYRGVSRRFEILRQSPVTVVSDYAHHPTKIKALLDAARDCFGSAKLRCVFQPHQANRTYHLFDDFAKSFGNADEVIVTDIFYARDSAQDRARVSSKELATAIAAQGKNARYIADFPQVSTYLKNNWQPQDVILVIGAGTIVELAHSLAKEF